MSQPDDTPTPFDPKAFPVRFSTTSWIDIALAQKQGEPGANEAMERLCGRYRPLLVEYLRLFRRLPGEPDDLVQDFFLDFLRRHAIKHADRRRGLFRSLILSSVRNFISKEWEKVNTKKRGGGLERVELIEEIFPGSERETADRAFDRAVGRELVERATRILREEYAERELAAPFEELLKHSTGAQSEETVTALAQRLGVRPNTLHKAMSDLRSRHREILRRCVAELLGPGDDVDNELRYLLGIYEPES